jgi:hypothetical protein
LSTAAAIETESEPRLFLTEELPPRDFVQEMHDLVARYLASSPLPAGQQALDIVTHLEHADPELLLGWARAALVSNVAALIHQVRGNDRLRSRSHARALLIRIGNGTATSAELAEASVFSVRSPVVSDDGMTKRIGELTGSDHAYIAGAYEVRGRRQLVFAAFHRLLAERVGDRTTEEVFNPEEYAALQQQLVG